MQSNPFNYGMPVSPKQFIGRWEQVRTVAADLTNPAGLSHALIGGRRFGKSSFLEALQYVLIKQLAQAQPGELYVFPVLVSLKDLEHRSPGGIFALMLRTLYDYFHSPLRKQTLGYKLDLDLTQTLLGAFIQSNERECLLERFSEIVEELLLVFINTYGLLRPIFLIDETEEILEQEWTEIFFSQARSLIYAGKLRDYVRCVLAGSSKLIEVREKGSPLLNMLKVVYLESLSDEDILEIIHWAEHVPEDLARAVLQQCGGHPFLAQYIMHYAWDSLRKGVSTARVVPTIVNRFRSECRGNLTQWQSDVGKAGLIVYQVLAEANTWLNEAQVKQRVHDERLIPHVGSALISLCYHGLVRQTGIWLEYRTTGQFFKDWFDDEILPTLHTQGEPATSPSTKTIAHSPLISAEPGIDIQLPKPSPPNYPTAYCHAVTVDRFPFVKCEIDNTHPDCTNAKITIEATIQGFSEPYSDTLDVPSGRCEQTDLLPRLSREKVLSLTETYKATCRVLVKRLFTQGEQILRNKTYEIQLLAFNTALLAVLDEQGNLAEDLSDYLSVFVTPNKQEVQNFMGVAAGEHPDDEIVGYQGAVVNTAGEVDREQACTISRRQAKAFFNALKKHAKLHYINSPVNLGKQPHQLTQRIRFAFQSLPQSTGQRGQANCLDGAILFASLLENAGMEPLILLVPGHAFVGWRIWRGVDEYDFLETTMIKTNNFETALAEGNRRYREAIQRGDHQRQFLDPGGFLRIVDITACRNRGIYALT